MKIDYRQRYEEYLKSDNWALKRKEKALEQNYTCEKCDKKVYKGFHIHHITYERLGNEKLSDLMFLCEDCHINEHCKIKALQNNKKTKSKHNKKCDNCYYSQIEKHLGKKTTVILYCNKNMDICDGVCKFYRKGEEKRLPKAKPQNKPTKTKKISQKTNFNCKYCNSSKYIIKVLRQNTGVYCAKCGKWQKFLNKKEREQLGIIVNKKTTN